MVLSDYIAYGALIISSINLIWIIISHSRKIGVQIISYRDHKFPNYYWSCFGIMIENNSRLPISISRIIIDNFNTKCEFNKQQLTETTKKSGDVIKSIEYTYSVQLPLNIPGLDSKLENFIFKSKVEIKKTDKLNITVITNRGKIKKKIAFSEDTPFSF